MVAPAPQESHSPLGSLTWVQFYLVIAGCVFLPLLAICCTSAACCIVRKRRADKVYESTWTEWESNYTSAKQAKLAEQEREDAQKLAGGIQAYTKTPSGSLIPRHPDIEKGNDQELVVASSDLRDLRALRTRHGLAATPAASAAHNVSPSRSSPSGALHTGASGSGISHVTSSYGDLCSGSEIYSDEMSGSHHSNHGGSHQSGSRATSRSEIDIDSTSEDEDIMSQPSTSRSLPRGVLRSR